ncbi:uncharacterized protein LOC135837097 [Planococcus citri]|uniref:uncharacterized protein LOC135837097 n=1 Tax=Planococcus citri TaxID=170843 RepID=UPI0031FA2F40
MNNRCQMIFVILFICQEINAAQSSNNDSMKYDLTNVLNDAILRLLKGTYLFEKLEPEILIQDPKHQNNVYKINNTQKLQPFGNTISLKRMFTVGLSSNRSKLFTRNPLNTSTIRWEFPENKFHMTYDELNYRIKGYVQVEDPYSYWNDDYSISEFHARYHEYKNLSITAIKPLANSSYNENIFFNTSYDHLENPDGIKLAKHPALSYEEHLELTHVIGLELPSIMRNFFINSGNFTPLLDEIFNLNPKQHIISAHPDFLTNEQWYYYHIPDIYYIYLSFQNIIIEGLSNFESYANNKPRNYDRYEFDNDDHHDLIVYTLHVKDVRGNMTLHPHFKYSYEYEYFKLNFCIGNLYISFAPKNEEFHVEAQDYSIVEDTPRSPTVISSWLSKHSTTIIQVLESEIIDLVKMPSKIRKPCSLCPQVPRMEFNFLDVLKNFVN